MSKRDFERIATGLREAIAYAEGTTDPSQYRIHHPSKPRKLAYTIAEATAATGMSDDWLYERHHAGEITMRKAGRRTLITAEDLGKLISNLPTLPRKG